MIFLNPVLSCSRITQREKLFFFEQLWFNLNENESIVSDDFFKFEFKFFDFNKKRLLWILLNPLSS